MNLELFRKFNVVKDHPDLDKITDQAYKDLEEKIWRENLESSPHGRPWFTSFHASSFPDMEKACGRKALYTMLDTPEPEPISPFLRGVAEAGKAIEYQIVYRWIKAGIMLGVKEPKFDGAPIEQLKFEDPETWLTGSCDAVLDLRPEYKHVVPVDVKSKTQKVLDEMLSGQRSYEPKNYLQVQAYLYLCNKFHKEMGWEDMGLLPANGAYIYYVSRENPRSAKEFFVPINWDVINNGVEKLKEWQIHFIEQTLPERPKSWRWTEEPCKWCVFKKEVCKPDYKEKIQVLSESNAIKVATKLRKDYDYKEIRKEVESRWH